MRRCTLCLLLLVAGTSLADEASKGPRNPFFAMDTGFRRPGLTTEQQLDVLKDLGYAGIAWTDAGPADAKKVAELAKKLQSATALYSYESSATCTLAMLCGCPLVAMTLPGYEQLGFSSQALSIYGGRGYALTDSEDDLRMARDGLPHIRQGMLNLARVFQNDIATFIGKTQHRADTVRGVIHRR